MTSLEGKVIALTGAASGIGRATSLLLASRGASLCLGDIRQEALDDIAESVRGLSSVAKTFTKVVNVVKPDDVASWLDAAIKELGKLDGAVNLAAISGALGQKPITELNDEDWDSVMDVNVKGVFNCLRAELKRMKENGSVVNISSVAGLRATKDSAPYCTSKHAVIGLSRVAAKEACQSGIKVNVIAPGAIDTPMMDSIADNYAAMGRPDFKQIVTETIPLTRMAKPVEVAKLIAFLLSDENTYITGAVYSIDGGLTA